MFSTPFRIEMEDPFDLDETINVDAEEKSADEEKGEKKFFLFEEQQKFVCLVCYPTFQANQSTKLWSKSGRGFRGVFSLSTPARCREDHLAEHRRDEQARVKSSSGEQSSEPSQKQRRLEDYLPRKTSETDFALLWLLLGSAKRKMRNEHVRRHMGAIMRSSNVLSEQALSQAIKLLAQKTREGILQAAKNKSVLLAIDGGTILRRSFLNVCVAFTDVLLNERRVCFWKTFKADRLTSAFVREKLLEVRGELLEKQVHPIGCCSDSARAMVKAVETLAYDEGAEDQRDDTASTDSDDEGNQNEQEENLDKVFEGAIDANDTSFFHHIRCWVHTLQLLLGDMVKKCELVSAAVAACVRVVNLLQRRENASLLKKICEEKRLKTRPLHSPAVTRWNSFIRAMQSIVELEEVVNFILKGNDAVAPKEMYAMRVTLMILTPICIWTDKLQGNNATMIDGHNALISIEEDLGYLLKVNFPTDRMKNEISQLVAALRSAIQKRRTFFNNQFFKLNNFFDPKQTETDMTNEEVAAEIEQYYVDRAKAKEIDRSKIQSALSEFELRTAEEAKMSLDKYWFEQGSRALRFPHTTTFVKDLTDNVLMSEAVVERSFFVQKERFSSKRNRLSPESLNDELMILFNQPPQEKTAKKREVHLTNEEWKALVLTLAEPTVEIGMRTRIQQKHQDAANLKVLDRVRVWFEGEKPGWWNGTIVGKAEDKIAAFHILYDSSKVLQKGKKEGGTVEIHLFQPTGPDNRWERLVDEEKE